MSSSWPGTALPCRVSCEGSARTGDGRALPAVLALAAAGRGNLPRGGHCSSSAAVTSVVQGRVAADGERVVRRQPGDGLQLQIRAEEDVLVAAPPLKSGRLIDKLLYREKFVIRCYEVGTNRTASMETMANLLQVRVILHCHSLSMVSDEIVLGVVAVWRLFLSFSFFLFDIGGDRGPGSGV